MENNQNTDAPVENNLSMPASTHNSGKNPRMAGFFERLLALIIDNIIVGIAAFIAGAIFGAFVAMASGFNPDADTSSATTLMGGLIGMAISYAYLGYFYTTKGQTLGKMAMKMKVVKADNLGYMNWLEVALREILGKMVSGVLLYLGYLWYFMSEKRQAWHDMIASTYVVKTDDSGNILMDGPAEYPKEPVKTFGLCGVFGLMFLAAFAMVVYGMAIAGQAISDEIQNRNLNSTDVNVDGDFRLEINGEEVPLDDEEDMQQYFEQNFEQDMEVEVETTNGRESL